VGAFKTVLNIRIVPDSPGSKPKDPADPRRRLMPGIRTLDRLPALEDQQELR